jgi:hypothetical protein
VVREVRNIIAVIVLALLVLANLFAQGTTFLNQTVRVGVATSYELKFPEDDGAAGEILKTDGAGNLSWGDGTGVVETIASGVILFSSAGACPAAWTEYTASRGLYLVGLPSGGTNLGTSGTALTTLEARAVGTHTHVQDSHTHVQTAHTHTQDSHNHTQNSHSHTVSGIGNSTGLVDTMGADADVLDDSGTLTTNTTTAVNNAAAAVNQSATATNQAVTATNQNTGVAGTPAPYIQLIACQKD